MKIAYCDCCKAKIGTFDKIYSAQIKSGNDDEFILEDVCGCCFDRLKGIIENAEKWRNNQNL